MQRTSRTLSAPGPLLHPRDMRCVAFATKRQGAGGGSTPPGGSGQRQRVCRWHRVWIGSHRAASPLAYWDGEPGVGSGWRVVSVRPRDGNEQTLCGAGRNDNLDESGFRVVDQARYDAAADVAHDNRFTKVETEHVGWIDTRVDAVEDLESMWRGKREASERAACDEGGVRRKTLLASVSRLVGRQPERTTNERGPAPSAHYRFARDRTTRPASGAAARRR